MPFINVKRILVKIILFGHYYPNILFFFVSEWELVINISTRKQNIFTHKQTIG